MSTRYINELIVTPYCCYQTPWGRFNCQGVDAIAGPSTPSFSNKPETGTAAGLALGQHDAAGLSSDGGSDIVSWLACLLADRIIPLLLGAVKSARQSKVSLPSSARQLSVGDTADS